MRKSLVAVLLGLASLASHGQRTLPPDVARFVQRRDLCDHFRGEEPYDAERRAFLEKRMREFCTGTDAKLATLKRKYKGRSDAMAKLGEYEATIESP
jgi:hypothetical protein